MAHRLIRLPRAALVGMVLAYRYLLKPWLGNACRFEPSCSAYTLQALREQGALRGVAWGAWRVARCHPWCEGGCDPLPASFSTPAAGLFTRLGLIRAEPYPPTQKPP